MNNSETLAGFIKEFNALKSGYHACLNNRGVVDIVIDGRLKASLMSRQSLWTIENQSLATRNCF